MQKSVKKCKKEEEGGYYFFSALIYSNPLSLSRKIFLKKNRLWGVTLHLQKKEKVGNIKIFNIMAKKQKNKTVEGVKHYLVNVLKENDLYNKKLGYQIEAASSTIVLFRLIRDYILENDLEPVVEEKSRENAIRKKEHPAFRIYAVFDSLLRKDLRALMMNLERIKSSDDAESGDDALTEMIENLRDD